VNASVTAWLIILSTAWLAGVGRLEATAVGLAADPESTNEQYRLDVVAYSGNYPPDPRASNRQFGNQN
jgi:hypothetical protein